jgi:hypothetical protein
MNTLTWLDRLRIERTVQALELLVSDLPGPARRAMRREIRTNLRLAAAEHGSKVAVRRLGDLRVLAAQYIDAEYGDAAPRPQWRRATVWALTAEVFVFAITFAGYAAFVDGVEAADPRPAGTYTWRGLEWLGIGGNVTYSDATLDRFGISFSAWALLPVVIAAVVGGRLWRLPRAWWQARHRHARVRGVQP